VATKCIKSYKKKILCLALTLATTFYPIFSLKIIFLMIIILRYQLKFLDILRTWLVYLSFEHFIIKKKI